MSEYQYRPILSKEQIAKYLWRQKCAVRIFLVLFLAASVVTLWDRKPDSTSDPSPYVVDLGPVSLSNLSAYAVDDKTPSSSSTSGPFGAAAVYFMLILLGAVFLFFRFNPDCTPMRKKREPQLRRWCDDFYEVDERVQTIFRERDFIPQYEFEEIEKSVAALAESRQSPYRMHTRTRAPMSDRAELLALNQEMAEIIKRMQV